MEQPAEMVGDGVRLMLSTSKNDEYTTESNDSDGVSESSASFYDGQDSEDDDGEVFIQRNKTRNDSNRRMVDVNDEEALRSNPVINNLLEKMMKEKTAGTQDKVRSRKCKRDKTPTGRAGKPVNPLIKSPSDTTLYVPAVKMTQRAIDMQRGLFTSGRDGNQGLIDQIMVNDGGNGNISNAQANTLATNDVNTNPNIGVTEQQIANFIQNLHLESSHHTPSTVSRGEQHHGNEQQPSTSRMNTNPDKETADRLVIDAEKFRATVAAPPGQFTSSSNEMFNNMTEFLRLMAANKADDEFFHITCHVAPVLKGRIKRGEYVDLDKLLPKNRMQVMTGDDEIAVVRRNGDTFTIPQNKETKITNIRKWKQAFRVYAAIYSNANPNRSAEIWQYVYVINTAAMSYAWENVLYYDFTFRQLMHANPTRSWAKTYSQIWSLAMCDPIHKNPGNGNSHGSRPGLSGNNKFDWRDNCCWGYNKAGSCRRWNCKFDHRCSFCGSFSHAKIACVKKRQSDSDRDNKSRGEHSPQSHGKRKDHNQQRK